jgi:hypothetical protein
MNRLLLPIHAFEADMFQGYDRDGESKDRQKEPGTMKSGFIFMLAACLAATGVSSVAVAQGGFGPPELTLVEVRDGIYTIRNAGSGNASLLVGDEGAILIDDKFPQDFDGIVEFVRSVTDAPLLYVINTHLHPDHVGGNTAMQGIGEIRCGSGSTIYLSICIISVAAILTAISSCICPRKGS